MSPTKKIVSGGGGFSDAFHFLILLVPVNENAKDQFGASRQLWQGGSLSLSCSIWLIDWLLGLSTIVYWRWIQGICHTLQKKKKKHFTVGVPYANKLITICFS